MAIGIRDWAKKKGINPNDIKYDPTTKKVTVAGMNVGGGTPTYATKYVPQQLSDMTRNYVPQKVQTGSMYNEYKLNDQYDQTQIDAASRAREQARMNYERMLGQDMSNLKYDVTNDSAYKSALAQAQDNIAKANRDNAEYYASRGMLNDSYAKDRTDRIAAEEMSRLQTQIAPQLEQRAYEREQNRWKDMVNMALQKYNLATDTYNTRFGAYDKAVKERQARAQQLSEMYGKPVSASADPNEMLSQVAGMKTLSQLEMEQKAREADAKLRQQVAEAQASQAMKERNARVQEGQLKLSQDKFDWEKSRPVSTGGGSGGSGGSSAGGNTKPAKGESPAFTPLTEAEKRLEEGFVATKQSYDPTTGTMTTVSGKRTVEKKDVPKFMQAVNSMGVTAKDKIALYNTFGLQKQASQIYLSPDYQLAIKSPDALISTLASRYSNNPNEFERMVGYYGLWNYYIGRLND